MIWAVDAVGLLTVATMIARRRGGWVQIAAVIAVIAAAYGPFVYLWRYHYQVYNLLLFAAAAGALQSVRRVSSARIA